MSNYSYVFHKCGDVFRDTSRLFSSAYSCSRDSGSLELVIPPIIYGLIKNFYDYSDPTFSSNVSFSRIKGYNAIVIPPSSVENSKEIETLCFVSSNISRSRVVL